LQKGICFGLGCSIGAGRAKREGRVRLRPNRGFPLGLARKAEPLQILARIISRQPANGVSLRCAFSVWIYQGRAGQINSNGCFVLGHVAGEGDAGSPGSDGASPYLGRGSRFTLPEKITPANSGYN
jgi:hypothetical protein